MSVEYFAPSRARQPEFTDIEDEVAREVHRISVSEWGSDRAVSLVGRDPALSSLLRRLRRFASADAPVLITGETGTGKELFAQSLYLMSSTHRRTFVAVNCAQYCGTELVASELFGHRKGSFTGAVSDHRGVFEEADGGTVFLDEIGDLPPAAQSMLLRVLSGGEVVPVGGGRARRVDIRVVAATSRDLREMIASGRFREDLYYRLRQLHVHIPPVRDRGDDWKLILLHFLGRSNLRYRASKRFAEKAFSMLNTYHWPGNVREVRSVVETGFHMSETDLITTMDIGEALESYARELQFAAVRACPSDRIIEELVSGDRDFWSAVHAPFLEREINRTEARAVLEKGLKRSNGSYKRLLPLFGMAGDDYLKFMDFLRHHRLKPAR